MNLLAFILGGKGGDFDFSLLIRYVPFVCKLFIKLIFDLKGTAIYEILQDTAHYVSICEIKPEKALIIKTELGPI